MTIRIIAGRAKGRRLHTSPGQHSRPTAARVRQTLFDILAPRLPGCRFLDACAGSGAIGLEALSRGAARVVLVETDAAALQAIRANAKLLEGGGGELEVLRQDARIALPALSGRGRRFDVIYLDPPYASDLYQPLLEAIARGGLLEADGVVVAEHFKKRALPETIGGLAQTRSVRVGDHALGFYAWREGGSAS
jgi:16S rRNA (guanine(966)-N(2))-methyltransferase RsmD